MKIATLKITNLVYADFEPDVRITKEALDDLFHDIQENGQVTPISVVAVGKKLVIADGHRRVECLKRLNKRTVKAVILDNVTPADAFRMANASARKMSGYEAQCAWLVNPDTAGKRSRLNFEKAWNFFGETVFMEIHSMKLSSTSIYQEASSIRKSMALHDADFAVRFTGPDFWDLICEMGIKRVAVIRKDPDVLREAKGKRFCSEMRKLLKKKEAAHG